MFKLLVDFLAKKPVLAAISFSAGYALHKRFGTETVVSKRIENELKAEHDRQIAKLSQIGKAEVLPPSSDTQQGEV